MSVHIGVKLSDATRDSREGNGITINNDQITPSTASRLGTAPMYFSHDIVEKIDNDVHRLELADARARRLRNSLMQVFQQKVARPLERDYIITFRSSDEDDEQSYEIWLDLDDPNSDATTWELESHLPVANIHDLAVVEWNLRLDIDGDGTEGFENTFLFNILRYNTDPTYGAELQAQLLEFAEQTAENIEHFQELGIMPEDLILT
jgi:hypothetical protein